MENISSMRLSLIAVDLILGILAIQCLTTESLFGKKQVEHESDEDLAARKSVNAGLEALKLASKNLYTLYLILALIFC